MNESRYEIILFWDKTDSLFVAEVPELSGCMAHGPTRAVAVESAEEAIALWIETAKEDGVPVPEPRGKLMYA
jgi:predicted RNase H-like HicB family nuclease